MRHEGARRSRGRLVTGVVLAALAVVLVGPPVGGTAASAAPYVVDDRCEKFDLGDPSQVRDKATAADAIFEGKVLRSRKRVRSSGDADVANTVRVLAVYSGDVADGARVTVVTGLTRDDGLGSLSKDGRYLFFATELSNGTLIATQCGGTTALEGALPGEFRTVVEQVLAEAEAERAEVTLSEPDGGTTTPPSLGRSVAPGIALGLVGVLGLLVVIAFGARRPH
jgi:hypothetical protein